VTIISNSVYFSIVARAASLDVNSIYEMRIPSNFIKNENNLASFPGFGFTQPTTWRFGTATVPQISVNTFIPARNTSNVNTLTLSVEFSQNFILNASGNSISVIDKSSIISNTFSIPPANLIVRNNLTNYHSEGSSIVDIVLPGLFLQAPGKLYSIVIPSNLFKSFSNNSLNDYPGLADGDWQITTTGALTPNPATYSPSNGSTVFPNITDLSLNFSERIQRVSSSLLSITITDLSFSVFTTSTQYNSISASITSNNSSMIFDIASVKYLIYLYIFF